MKANSFLIFSGWEPRPDSPEKLGQRTLSSLKALVGTSPYFAEWWMDGQRIDVERMIDEGLDPEEIESRIEEDELPLEDVRDQMTKVVESGVRRGDDGEPEPAGGYSIRAKNGLHSSPRRVSFHAHGGGILDPRAGLRFAELETADSPDPAIVSYPVFKSALMSLISAWEVRFAQAYSKDLCKLWNEPCKLFLDLAWMTYLSPELAQGFVVPNDVHVEQISDGGILMAAAEETFDTANPRHIAGAQSILRSLAKINLEEERRWQLLWPTQEHGHQ